ncbi:MAG TPA: hypothetical protein VN737_21135 [Bryobacteraceae bacterium]|nr:hypothetical protein [Bryobacteraceae bacterium]
MGRSRRHILDIVEKDDPRKDRQKIGAAMCISSLAGAGYTACSSLGKLLEPENLNIRQVRI